MQFRYHSFAGHFIIDSIFNKALQYLSIRLDHVLLSPTQECNKHKMFSRKNKSPCIICECCTISIDINSLVLKKWYDETQFVYNALPLYIIVAYVGLHHLGNPDLFEECCAHNKIIPNYLKQECSLNENWSFLIYLQKKSRTQICNNQ